MSAAGAVRDWSRKLLRGGSDRRLRATWRVLLAAALLIPLSEVVAVLLVGATGIGGRWPVGVVQATFLTVVLLGWARHVDERPLSAYGVAATPSWAVDLLAGVGAVGLAWGLWFAVGTLAGWTTVAVSASAPGGSLLLGLVAAVVALGLNVWVQDTVFWALVARNAGEGFHARGMTATHAIAAAWAVGVLYYVLAHGQTGLAAVANLLVGGAVFGLLYVQTGDLALTVGAHGASNLVASHVFVPADRAGEVLSMLAVTGGYPGPAVVNDTALARTAVAYLLLLGWVWVRHGDVGLETDLARWSGR